MTRTASTARTRPAAASAGRTVRSKVEQYRDKLFPLMEYIHQRSYLRDHEFTREELLAVTPEAIVRYLKLKVYGDEDANPDVDPPRNYRLNTIKVWKKSWSYFMPNKTMTWNEVARIGNPTRSSLINDLFGAINKMETARRGVPSQARRSLKAGEYECAIELMCEHKNKEVSVWLPAFNALQFNLIGRVDDTAKWRAPDLRPLERFEDYGVCVRLCWSKNVRDARDAPTQVLFGSDDWRYCSVSLLAVWLELHWMLNPEENELFLALHGATDPVRIKEAASHHL